MNDLIVITIIESHIKQMATTKQQAQLQIMIIQAIVIIIKIKIISYNTI